ncbi:MAG: hypothetical protein R3A52_17575 [Polyangiales bacterium]
MASVLRASDLGVPTRWLPLAWGALSLLRALAAAPGGRVADRFGRGRALALGWALYAVAYLGFGHRDLSVGRPRRAARLRRLLRPHRRDRARPRRRARALVRHGPRLRGLQPRLGLALPASMFGALYRPDAPRAPSASPRPSRPSRRWARWRGRGEA